MTNDFINIEKGVDIIKDNRYLLNFLMKTA